MIPLLQSNATTLAALSPPIKHPLSLLSHLTSLPPPEPYVLPSGETLHPPSPSGISSRKLVIFGDCSGGTRNPRFQQMCEDPSLLVHECTNGSIPERTQRGEKGRKVRISELESSLVKQREQKDGCVLGRERSGPAEVTSDAGSTREREAESRLLREEEKKQKVRVKAQGRGHSTPDEVGEFAKSIRARRVVLNHFSAM